MRNFSQIIVIFTFFVLDFKTSMGIFTGRDEGIKLIEFADYAFIGTLTDCAKGSYDKQINEKIVVRINIYVRRYVDKISTTNRSLYTGI